MSDYERKMQNAALADTSVYKSGKLSAAIGYRRSDDIKAKIGPVGPVEVSPAPTVALDVYPY
ncbi:hypothetical protein ACFQ14_01290 [Pseudahrensia aquimaris]|uniref:Uncharacterized protein n=1 Tax=Pseudahrensia aquimaris TaxID=744461 RepID=A0ABW3FDP2_9HYPH